ncbi:MAG: trypsin-like serine protease, partial [Planctomycetaceae bacterium]
MPVRLVVLLVPLILLSICRSGWGVGGLHTVSEDAYLRAARNEGEYKAGPRYPDFRSVCVVGRFRDSDDWQGSGVLVAPGWVLTAAHCVLRKKKAPRLERDLKVRFGSRIDDRSREYRVEAIHLTLPLDPQVLRPLLSERKVSRAATRHADRNDIALLKLDRHVEGIPVAALFEGRAEPGSRICFAGFGSYATGRQKKEKHWKEDGWKRAAENTLDRDGHHPAGGLIAFDF